MIMRREAKEIKSRTLSALVLAPLVLLVVYLGSFYFLIAVTMSCVMMSLEWTTIIKENISSKSSKIDRFIWNVFGFVYIVMPCVCLVYIREGMNGLQVTLWLFLTVWATDIGAYFAGTILRGPKIFPRISPNKTWAGLCGGILAAYGVGYLFYIENLIYHINFAQMSIAVAIIAQLGDFLESAIKRNFKIKDSGQLIPGHGGLLDRLDGLITASVFVAMLELVAIK